MRLLIVASNESPPGLTQEVEQRRHQRVDYIALAERLGGDYVDYGLVPNDPRIRRLEEKLRLDLRQAIRVAQLIRRKKYDTVLSWSERVGIPLALLLGKSVKQVVILNHPLSPKKVKLLRALQVHRRWTRIIFISQAEAQPFCQALQIDPDRASVLHTPIDTAFFSPANTPGVIEQNYVHSVGLSYRDYATLIRAIRQLPHIPCHFRVGSAWVHNPMDYENESIPPNVKIQPYVHPSELRRYFTESRFTIISVQPTTQWTAGCTSVQIAQAMGRPVVATRLPGLAEYMIDGETGILVEPRDPQGLRDAVEALWRDAARAETMGCRAREWTHSRFAFEGWLDRMANVMTSV
jgi:glycosyltransferase involved in cell wall biosynthesis